MEGKRFAWQGIALLPFIDEKRLLSAVEEAESTLTDEERRRNSPLDEVLFITMSNPLSPQVYVLYDKHVDTEVSCLWSQRDFCALVHIKVPFFPSLASLLLQQGEERAAVIEKIDSNESIEINGFIKLCAGKEACPPTFPSPLPSLPDVEDSEVLTALFKNPEFHPHKPRLLDGAVLDPPTITEADFEPTRKMWHELNTLPQNGMVGYSNCTASLIHRTHTHSITVHVQGSSPPYDRRRQFESSAGHMAHAAYQQRMNHGRNYGRQHSGSGYGQVSYSDNRYENHRHSKLSHKHLHQGTRVTLSQFS